MSFSVMVNFTDKLVGSYIRNSQAWILLKIAIVGIQNLNITVNHFCDASRLKCNIQKTLNIFCMHTCMYTYVHRKIIIAVGNVDNIMWHCLYKNITETITISWVIHIRIVGTHISLYIFIPTSYFTCRLLYVVTVKNTSLYIITYTCYACACIHWNLSIADFWD